ncbi:MAG: transglycosylase domain-containing protein [Comamonas sp.]
MKIDFELISININDSKILNLKDDGIKELIFAEDHRYLFHFGVDFIAMVRAIYSTKVHKKFQGASTIEQQLVRVISARYEKSLKRKIREQILAVLISRNFKKYEIAKCYLINAYMGHKRKGMLQALDRSNFGVDSDQFYFIAALLKYPHPMEINKKWTEKISYRVLYIKNRELKYSNYLKA